MERGFLSLVGTKPALHGGGALSGGAFAETAEARRRQQRPRGAAALGALRRGRAAPQGVLAVPKLFGTAPLLQQHHQNLKSQKSQHRGRGDNVNSGMVTTAALRKCGRDGSGAHARFQNESPTSKELVTLQHRIKEVVAVREKNHARSRVKRHGTTAQLPQSVPLQKKTPSPRLPVLSASKNINMKSPGAVSTTTSREIASREEIGQPKSEKTCMPSIVPSVTLQSSLLISEKSVPDGIHALSADDGCPDPESLSSSNESIPRCSTSDEDEDRAQVSQKSCRLPQSRPNDICDATHEPDAAVVNNHGTTATPRAPYSPRGVVNPPPSSSRSSSTAAAAAAAPTSITNHPSSTSNRRRRNHKHSSSATTTLRPASSNNADDQKKHNEKLSAQPNSALLRARQKQRPASQPPPMVYYARDLRGRRHDIKALRVRRTKSVLKGMRFMRKFLRRKKYKALYEIGDDAPSIFFEIWYTSADSRIRAEAKGTARELLGKLEHKMARDCGKFGVPDRDEFFALMFLARIRHEMGDEKELHALLKRADVAWRRNGYEDNTDHLFDYKLGNLGGVDTDAWLGLLMRILIMEYNNLLFPRRFPLEWGMREALETIKDLQLDGPGGDDFHASFFLATHIIYALGAYSAIKTREQDCPWLYKYLRISMRFWMKEAWRRNRIEALVVEERERNARILDQARMEEEEEEEEVDEEEVEDEEVENVDGDGGVEETETEDLEEILKGEDTGEGMEETMAAVLVEDGGLDAVEKALLVPSKSNSEIILPNKKDTPDFVPVAKRFPQVRAVNPVRRGCSPRQTHEWVYVDVDGVSEIIDTFRGCGLTSASDRLVCEGSLFLLRTQRKDGSWPYWNKEGDGSKDPDCNSYDLLHPTWVAVQGLRDRDFKLDRPAAEKWRTWINKIVADVGFADDPTYENNWMSLGSKTKRKGKKGKTRKQKKKKRKKKKLKKVT